MSRVRCFIAYLLSLSLFLSLHLGVHVNAAGADPGDSSQLLLEGRWACGPAFAVSSHEDIVICGIGSRLQIVDLSTPGTPDLLGKVDLPAPIYDIVATARYCYTADSEAGLRIVDLYGATGLVEVGGLSLPGEAYALDLQYPYLYVAAYDGGLRIVDVSTPSAPVEIGSFDTDCYAMDVKVVGALAYVADMYDGGLKVFDVSDPQHPVVDGFQTTDGPPWSVDVAGQRAYVVDDYAGFHAFDLSGGGDPQLLATVWMDDLGYQVQVQGDYAYVAEDWEGLAIYDVSALPVITPVGWHDTPGSCWRETLDGDRIYLADQEGGIRIMDVSTISNPTEIGTWNPVGFSRRVVVRDRYAYVSCDSDGLRIIDSFAAGGPKEVGHLALPGSPWNLDIEGDYAYVACQSAGGCRIVDISDPTNPFEAAFFFTPYYSLGKGVVSVDAQGDYLYLVDYYYGLYVYDIHDPTHPVPMGNLGLLSYPTDLAVAGQYAYVVDRAGLRAIDLSSFSQVFWDPHDHTLVDVEIEGNRLYVSEGYWGVDVYDLSDPSFPEFLIKYDTQGTAQQISSAGDFLYVANGSRLKVLDVADPMQIQLVGYYDTGANAIGVDSDGQRVYLADSFDGLFVLKNLLVEPMGVDGAPSDLRVLLAQNYPNPFNPSTSIQYYLPSPGPVELRIYDVSGRKVRELIAQRQEAGFHDQSWDGKDTTGQGVSSGVYHYELKACGQTRTRSMVLLR